MDQDHKLYRFIAEEDQEGMRLDQFLAGELSEHSRSYIGKLCKEGGGQINGKKQTQNLNGCGHI